MLRLPSLVSREYLQGLTQQLCSYPEGGGMRLIDFSLVSKVEMAGHQLLLTLSELQQTQGADIQLMAISPRLRRELAATRVLDALNAQEGNALSALVPDSRTSGSELRCRSYVLEDCALTFLGGRVDRSGLDALGIVECLEHTARDRDCIVDMRNVTLLETSAIIALQPFFSGTGVNRGRVVFSGLNNAVLQMVRMAGLGEPQNCITDQMLLSVICDGGLQNG